MLNFLTNKSCNDKLFNNNNYHLERNLAISVAIFYALLPSRVNSVARYSLANGYPDIRCHWHPGISLRRSGSQLAELYIPVGAGLPQVYDLRVST